MMASCNFQQQQKSPQYLSFLFLLSCSWYQVSSSSSLYYSYDDSTWACSGSLMRNITSATSFSYQSYEVGDETTSVIHLPWLFPFYNQQFDSMVISSNGILSFINTTSPPAPASPFPLSKPLISSSSSFDQHSPQVTIPSSLSSPTDKYIVLLHSHLQKTHYHEFLHHISEFNQHQKSHLLIEKSFPQLKMMTITSPTSDHLNYLKSHEYVSHIQKNIQFEINLPSYEYPDEASDVSTSLPSSSWGIDRINQYFLPLDHNYSIPSWTNYGQNVNIYVLDTGIDTTHREFTNSTHREVRNIYSVDGDISENNDRYGHGTHVAGTIGGNSIGVARNANIYGVKVLSPGGYGTTEMILAGMNYVLSLKQQQDDLQLLDHAPPMIVSMSLGYNCGDQCSIDALVIATKYLTDAGIIVVVAAGNSKFNACYYSPAAAPSAITVGATIVNDMFATTFSNYGQCVDILAPGVSIVSACSSTSALTCDASNSQYLTLSGTSMATPHISGILALWLSMTNVSLAFMSQPGRVQEITNLLQCGSILNQVTSLTSTTRNYFSHIPYQHETHFDHLTCPLYSDNSINFEKCNHLNCFHGQCVSPSSTCTCYPGYTGPFCNISKWQTSDALCCHGESMNDAFNYPFNSIALFWTDLDGSKANIFSSLLNSSTFGVKYENIALYGFGKSSCVISFEILLHSSGDIDIAYSSSTIGTSFCISSAVSIGMKGPYIDGLHIDSEQWYGPEALNLPTCTHRVVKYHTTPQPTESPTFFPTPTDTPTRSPINLQTNKPTPTPKTAPGPHLRPTQKPIMTMPSFIPTIKPKGKPKSTMSSAKTSLSKK